MRVDHLGRASLAVILYYGRDILCGSPWVVILDPWGYSCAVPVVVAWGRGPRTGGRYKRGKNGPKKVDAIPVGVALGGYMRFLVKIGAFFYVVSRQNCNKMPYMRFPVKITPLYANLGQNYRHPTEVRCLYAISGQIWVCGFTF